MYDFYAFGIPAPQGSKRHVGNGRMVESSKKVKPWRDAVSAEAALQSMSAPPMDGPIFMKLDFYLPRPARSKFGDFPAGPPDLDKLERSTLDALKMGGLISDDARVVAIHASKRWAKELSGAHIQVLEIREIGENA